MLSGSSLADILHDPLHLQKSALSTATPVQLSKEPLSSNQTNPQENHLMLVALDKEIQFIDVKQLANNLLYLAGMLELKRSNTGYNTLLTHYGLYFKHPLQRIYILENIYEQLERMEKMFVKPAKEVDLKEHISSVEFLQSALNAIHFLLCKIIPLVSELNQHPVEYYRLLIYFVRFMKLFFENHRPLYEHKLLAEKMYLRGFFVAIQNMYGLLYYHKEFERYLQNILLKKEPTSELFLKKVKEEKVWQAYLDLLSIYSDFNYIISLYGNKIASDTVGKNGDALLGFAKEYFVQVAEEKNKQLEMPAGFWETVTAYPSFSQRPPIDDVLIERHAALQGFTAFSSHFIDLLKFYEETVLKKNNARFVKNEKMESLANQIIEIKSPLVARDLLPAVKEFRHPLDMLTLLTAFEKYFVQEKERYNQPPAVAITYAVAEVVRGLIAATQEACNKITAFWQEKNPPAKAQVKKKTSPNSPSISLRELKKQAAAAAKRQLKESRKHAQAVSSSTLDPVDKEINFSEKRVSTHSECSESAKKMELGPSEMDILSAIPVTSSKKTESFLHSYQLYSKRTLPIEDANLEAELNFSDDENKEKPLSKTEINRRKRQLKRERAAQEKILRNQEEKEKIRARERSPRATSIKKEILVRKESKQINQTKENADKPSTANVVTNESVAKEQAEVPSSLEQALQSLKIMDNQPFEGWKGYQVPDRVIQLEPIEREILQALGEEGYWAFTYGGAVRDRLLNRQPNDIDIMTNCPPSLIKSVLKRRRNIDCAQNSNEKYYNRFHLPGVDLNCLTDKILIEALKGCDFYINTFCGDKDGQVFDFLRCLNHLNEELLYIINSSAVRYEADPRLMSRTVRLANQLNKKIPESEIINLKKYAHLFAALSFSEYLKQFKDLFLRGNALKNFDFLLRQNIFCYFVPMLQALLTQNELTVRWYYAKFAEIDQCSTDERANLFPPLKIMAFLLVPLMLERIQSQTKLLDLAQNTAGEFFQGFKVEDKSRQEYLRENLLSEYINYVNVRGGWEKQIREQQQVAARPASFNGSLMNYSRKGRRKPYFAKQSVASLPTSLIKVEEKKQTKLV